MALHEWNRKFENDIFIDPSLKKNYWYINTGQETERNGRKVPVVVILRKSEVAIPLASLVDGLLEKVHGEDDALKERLAQYGAKGLLSSTAAQYTPPIPRAGLEEAANFDFFRGQPIIPQKLQGVKAKYQFTTETPNTIRKIAEKTGWSPKRIEHITRSVFPASSQVFEASDAIFKPKPELPRKKKDSLIQLAQLFPVVRTPSGFYSRPESLAYNFEQASKEERRTPSFMAAESLRRYYEEQTPENLARAQNWFKQLSAKDRARVKMNVRRDFKLNAATPENRALMKLPKRDRKSFASQRVP